MDISLLKTQWDAFSSNPAQIMIFIAVAASASWWLRSTIDKGQIKALKAKHDVLEERARLAADKVKPAIEIALETDEKGNVKPPSTPSDSEKPEPDDGSDQFIWLVRMEYAYQGDDCLSTAEQYYKKLKAAPAAFPLPLIEATYRLALFRCGNRSGLSDLKTLSGPRSEAYHANVVLGGYYESIGERDAALRCVEDRYAHPLDMDSKLYSAFALAGLLYKSDNVTKSHSFLLDQLAVFQSADAHALIWEELGSTYDLQKMEWRKQLCFEKSLIYNPDNTDLRFSLAYSYGDSSY